jgi:adenylate cyclase
MPFMRDARIVERRLAAILAADVAGYSRLIERDEAGTLAALRDRQKRILDPLVRQHRGRIVKLMGDGVIVEFASPVNALVCAVELHRQFDTANMSLPEDRRILLRAGITLSDVVVEGGDLFGEGVIVAVRLQSMAEPGTICLSSSVHEQVAGKLALAFDDLGLCEVKNSSKPVRAFRVRAESGDAAGAPAQPARSELSIAVLPFDNLSGDAGQKYLSDGITEDITTELSRFKSLFVAARHASFRLAERKASPAQVARDLSVNYLLEGSARKSGERLRITAQLIDARTGSHIWAERYDRSATDIFAVQDEVVATIVATLEGRMTAAAAQLTGRKPTASWSAYDCLLRGRELANAGKEKDAVPLFSRAAAIDPNFAQAHAWLAIGLLATYWFSADAANLNEAAQCARRALTLDSGDPTVHHANAMVLLWLRQHDRAGMHFDRAISLNPSDIQIRADRANWLRYCGRPEQALAAIDDAFGRSPFPPHWFWRIRGGALLQLKRYGEAIDSFENMPDKDHTAYAQLAAAHAHLGDKRSAALALANAKKLRPTLTVSEVQAIVPHRDKTALNHYLDGLRNAGLEE